MTDQAPDAYREALRRGHVAVVKGRPREAISHYEEAGRLARQRPLPFVSMGSVYLQMRQPREAIRAFDEALRRAPSDVSAMRGKAAALEADGRLAAATALTQRSAELEAMERAGRGSRDGRHELRRELEARVAEGHQARAAGDLDRAAAAFHLAAIGYAGQDGFDAAMDACLRALEARPGAIDVHFTLAHLYLRRGWTEHGVQRVMLIERRLDIDADPRRRSALQALAHDYQALAPELERLASAPT
ncbi:MAG TPA: tetratricopeptide repeat protein [Candidatus Limnocylindrales bacterium]|nr:tetratricopeptide repeat protein [Candidatus Limnocylindrales bacterium]